MNETEDLDRVPESHDAEVEPPVEERPLDAILAEVESVLQQERAENLPPKDFPTAKATELLFVKDKIAALNKAVRELEKKRDHLEELVHPAFGLSGTERVVIQGRALRPTYRVVAVAKKGQAELVDALILANRKDMLQPCTPRLSSWVAELMEQADLAGNGGKAVLPSELDEHILVLRTNVISVRKV